MSATATEPRTDARRAGRLPRLRRPPLLRARDVCPGCGRSHPDRDGILEAIGPLDGPEPDRRGVLRRPGLAAVPEVGAALPGASRGGAAGADADPPPRPGDRSARRAASSRSASATARTSVPARDPGTSTASTSPGRSSPPAATAIPAMAGRWPGPRPRRCRSTTRRSTPATRSAASTTSTTTPRPCARCGGSRGRRPGRRRRRDARACTARASATCRPAGDRRLLAAPARARPRSSSTWSCTTTSISQPWPARAWPGRRAGRSGAAGYCLVDPGRRPLREPSELVTRRGP